MNAITHIIIRPYNGDSIYSHRLERPINGFDASHSNHENVSDEFNIACNILKNINSVTNLTTVNSAGFPVVLSAEVLRNSVFIGVDVPKGQSALEYFRNGGKK